MVFTFSEYRASTDAIVTGEPVETERGFNWCTVAYVVLFVVVGVVLYIVLVAPKSSFNGSYCAANKAKVMDTIYYPKTEQELMDIINESDCVVMFYALWCGHCKHFKPHFEEASKMPSKSKYVAVNAGEGDAFMEVMKRYGVKGFPTVLKFKNNSDPEMFMGERTAKAVSDFSNL